MGRKPHGFPEFNPLIAPTKTEWQYFHKMTDAQLIKLWTFEQQRGHRNLGAWAWQWRIGWLERCETNVMPDLCSQILASGLKDEAMVVRADAASRIGKRYEGKPSKLISDELTHAYRDARNSRHGNPLFVCERILGAMHQIGGEPLNKIATRLLRSTQKPSRIGQKLKDVRKNNPTSIVDQNFKAPISGCLPVAGALNLLDLLSYSSKINLYTFDLMDYCSAPARNSEHSRQRHCSSHWWLTTH